MPTATKKKKKSSKSATTPVKPVKHKGIIYFPVPSKLLRSIGAAQGKQYFWTNVDGVLQLSVGRPIMVISVLGSHPEKKFEPQDE